MHQKWWILLAIGLGSFLSTVSSSILNTVLPVIRQAFQSDMTTIQWILTVYLLIISGLLLGFGRLGDLFGHRKIYLGGLLCFALGSGLCALAPTIGLLILFRSIQAIGAAMLFANGPAILTRNFPPEERGRALGMQATLTYLGLMIGPPLGGWLASFGWQAVFFAPLPIALLAIGASVAQIPPDRPEEHPAPFDFLGNILFLAGLTTLLLGLNQGNSWGWASLPVLGLFAIALMLSAAFLSTQSKQASPLLDLRLFQSRVLSGTMLGAFFNYVCIYALLFLLPFYLIQGLSLAPGKAGLILMAQPLVMAIVSPIAGSLSDRVEPRRLATLGMMVLALGMGLLSRLDARSPILAVVLALAVAGFGTGLFTTPNNNALMGAAPRDSQGVAGGILATARNVGMALGVGLAGAIFTSFAKRSLFFALDQSFQVMILVAILGAAVSFLARETSPLA